MVAFMKYWIFLNSILGAVIHNCDAIEPNVERYTITGDTSDELRQQLGQACFNNQCFDASITYSLTEAITCSHGTYRVFIQNHIKMPRLGSTRNEVLRNNFGIFERNLYQHELNHLENGKRMCRFFVSELEKDSGNCTFNSSQLSDLQNVAYSNAILADREYDRRTVHGMTEGACFGFHCDDSCVGCRDRYIAGISFNAPTTSVINTGEVSVTTTLSPPVVATHNPVVEPPTAVSPSVAASYTSMAESGTTTRSAVVGSTTSIVGSGTPNPSDSRPVMPAPSPLPNGSPSVTPLYAAILLILLA
jgi:predicted secreted Zn-dependent protease